MCDSTSNSFRRNVYPNMDSTLFNYVDTSSVVSTLDSAISRLVGDRRNSDALEMIDEISLFLDCHAVVIPLHGDAFSRLISTTGGMFQSAAHGPRSKQIS